VTSTVSYLDTTNAQAREKDSARKALIVAVNSTQTFSDKDDTNRLWAF